MPIEKNRFVAVSKVIKVLPSSWVAHSPARKGRGEVGPLPPKAKVIQEIDWRADGLGNF